MSIDELLSGLDAEQRAAVTAPIGPLRILAGAGTGKTRSVTHRIAYQVHTAQSSPGSILAVTHSRKAAAELRERLAALGVRGVAARTFHAAALRQLAYFWQHTGLPGDGPDLLDNRARRDLIRQCVAAALRLDPAQVDSAQVLDTDSEITWAHAVRIDPEHYLTHAAAAGRVTSVDPQVFADAYARYEQAKWNLGKLDFDGLLACTAHLIENNDEVSQRIRSSYRNLLVDEYQDTNPAQQRLLDAWLGDNRALCVVGDDRQSIYGFRGADPQLLTDFTRRYPDALSIALVRDYRSTPQIVTLANKIAAAAPEAALIGQQPDGPEPHVLTLPDETAENEAIAATVRDLTAQGISADQIAVLHRFNAQSPAIVAALNQAGIRAVTSRDDAFYDRPDILSVLRAYASLTDHDPFQPALTVLERALRNNGHDPNTPPEATVGAVRERWELRQALLHMCQQLAPEARRDAATLLAELRSRAEAEHVPTGSIGVTVTTIHQAKGLEWDAVILPRMTDGSLPSKLATTAAERAEERRLFYVAVTRARHRLILTHAQTWGERSPSRPSPFLDHLRRAPARPAGRPGQRPPSSSARRHIRVQPGERVNHDRWGLGRVLTLTGAERAQIDFGSTAGVQTVATNDPGLRKL